MGHVILRSQKENERNGNYRLERVVAAQSNAKYKGRQQIDGCLKGWVLQTWPVSIHTITESQISDYGIFSTFTVILRIYRTLPRLIECHITRSTL